jgi:hypothetical protein
MVFGELDGAELATGIVLRHVPMPQTPDTIGNARFHRWGHPQNSYVSDTNYRFNRSEPLMSNDSGFFSSAGRYAGVKRSK